MTDSFLPSVDIPGVSKAYVLNYFGKGHFADLNDEVQMICHQTKTMNAVSEPFNTLLQQQIQPGSIRLGIKDILAAITTKNNVIESARIMNTRFAGHV